MLNFAHDVLKRLQTLLMISPVSMKNKHASPFTIKIVLTLTHKNLRAFQMNVHCIFRITA